jgi:hypothetical protein
MMSKFTVEQLVQCEVRVWYTVEALSHNDALALVARDMCPTSRSEEGVFKDYEIITDGNIISTEIKEAK